LFGFMWGGGVIIDSGGGGGIGLQITYRVCRCGVLLKLGVKI